MFGVPYFYNETVKKLTAIFGTLFNDIEIQRTGTSTGTQTVKVPIAFGPAQKFLTRIEQDPDLKAPAIILPRMAFEIMSYDYDSQRALTQWSIPVTAADSTITQFNPVPYNLQFNLYIMTKYYEDGSKIMEQILPFFRPKFTVSAVMIPGSDPVDIPIVLNSVSSEDSYEGPYLDSRTIIWTLSFTMKAYFFSPQYNRKVIKFIDIGVYGDTTATAPLERITIQPGLTANGEPTTDVNTSIPWIDIEETDDWAAIVKIEDYDE